MPRIEEFDDIQLDVEFTQADTRSNLTSNENIAISFGKISKWYEALVPTGGSSGQFLAWNSSGTAKWVSNPNVDTKVTSTLLAQSTAAATYLPTFVSAAGNSGVNIMNSFSFRHTVGTTSAVGNSRIVLGNATASGTANNEEGQIMLYSSSTSYHTIKGSATASTVTHSLPTTGGTILNTGTTSFTQTLTSGTKVGSIKINGTSTDIYAPTNTNTTYTLTQDATDGHKITLTPSSGTAQTVTIPDNNTTYTLSGAYGSSSNTWVTTLTPSSGTATTSTVPTASTSVYGITKLSSSTNSTSTALAATPSAVKSAYDLANGKSTVSFSASLTTGTKVGTITIDGTGTDIYCETNTNTDTKVTDTVGTANTYYPAGGTSTSTATGTQVFDTSLKFIGTTGTTSAVGKAQLVLGNSTASGTANNKQGSLVVYGSTAYAHTIQGAPTAARTLTLPDKAGTFALTSDIPSVPTVYNAALTLKGAGTTVTTFTANASSAKSLDIVAGSNVTVTADATNAKISIASSHPTITKSTDTTSTASPAHGGTFTVVDSVTREANGHVTKINTKTVTLPADSNTDTKVTQSQTTTTDYRPILFGAKNSTDASTLADTITDEAYTSTKMYAQPSTGLIFCTGRKINEVAIQTGSTKAAHITLQTLMTWLITTKTYIPSGQYCHVIISTTWAYANNDILQVNIDGVNYEIQLAGVIIEFIGSATSYNAGVFRLLIHSSPTTSLTPASGYTRFPVSTIAEYTCNGSDYSPTWKKIWNSHPTYTSKSSGLYKITVDGTGHVSAATAVAKADITALGIPGSDTNTTYTLGTSGNNVTLTPSSGSVQSITVPYASNAAASNSLKITGYGISNLTFYQANDDFGGTEGRKGNNDDNYWSHYIIANHGNGETYYHYTIRLPFWGSPQYQRKAGGSDATTGRTKWLDFITEENYTSYTVKKDGTGATGTWGISITGNADTATSATKATQDGDGNTISSTYLKLSGGTLTGAVNFANNTMNKLGDDVQFGDGNVVGHMIVQGLNNTTGINLKYASDSYTGCNMTVTTKSQANSQFIGLYNHDAYGTGVVLGGGTGGLMVLGGGESPMNFHSIMGSASTNPLGVAWHDGTENTIITADGDIYFMSGADNLGSSTHTDWTHCKTIVLDTSGNFNPTITNKGSVGTSSKYWATSYITTMYGQHKRSEGGPWISARTNAAVWSNSDSSTGDDFYPATFSKTKSGGWAMGTLGKYDRLIFSYTTDTDFSSGANTSTYTIYLPEASGTVALEGHTHNYAGSDTVGGVANNSYYLGDSTAPSTYKLRYINSNDTTTWTTSSLAATDSIAVIRGSVTGAWATGHIVTFNVATVGTPFQLGIHDSNELYFYKRYKTGTNTWSEWTKMNAGNADVATKLGTANKGSTTKGIYLDAGVPKEMTYSLGSTVNAGTANQLAYYSGANAISATHDGTNTNDSLYFKTGTNAKSARQIILGIYGQTYGNDASTLISGTAGVFSYGDGGPQIDFNSSSSGSQAGALIFTDHDTAGAGASWHFVSNQGDWNVTSKRFHARTGISIGTDKPTTSYNLYVNGTTYITGATTITNSSFAPFKIIRSGSTASAAIAFANSNNTLGYIGMTGSANGGLYRWNANTNIAYRILDDAISPACKAIAQRCVFFGKSDESDPEGWKRILTVPANGTSGKGINDIKLFVRRHYNNNTPESFSVHIINNYTDTPAIHVLHAMQSGKLCTKIRITKSSDGKFNHVEIYYNATKRNTITIQYNVIIPCELSNTAYNGPVYPADLTEISNISDTVTAQTTIDIPTNTAQGNLKNANGYWGMALPDGTDTDWIRTTSNGIIPYQSGGAGSGHGRLGTSSWYFSEAYIDTVHGSLSGAATSANKLNTDAGTTSIPVYFSGGVPVQCTTPNAYQTNTTTNADYRVLFSTNANDTTQSGTTRKNINLKYNPSTATLKIGDYVSGSTATKTGKLVFGNSSNVYTHTINTNADKLSNVSLTLNSTDGIMGTDALCYKGYESANLASDTAPGTLADISSLSNAVSFSGYLARFSYFTVLLCVGTDVTARTTVQVSAIAGYQSYQLIWGGAPNHSGGNLSITSGLVNITESSGTITLNFGKCASYWQFSSSSSTPTKGTTPNIHVLKVYGHCIRSNGYH